MQPSVCQVLGAPSKWAQGEPRGAAGGARARPREASLGRRRNAAVPHHAPRCTYWASWRGACREAVQMAFRFGAGTRRSNPSLGLAMMQKWRRRPLALAALLTLLASLVPAPAWACPVTGRVGTAAFVCEGMAQPCAQHGSPCCCHPVSLPSGSLDAQGEPAQASVATPPLRQVLLDPPGFEATSLDLAAVVSAVPAPELAESAAWKRPAPSFSWMSRHGPPLCSGRAPPVA